MMFPPHFGVAGICDLPGNRLPLEFGKPIPIPRPLRHPHPAHARNTEIRHNIAAEYALGVANQRALINNGSLPVLSFAPGTSHGSTVAMPTPLLPYPGMPFSAAGFPLGSPAQELQQLNVLQTLQRAPPTTGEQNKMKTPINRNYLELAMLVCNTFRGKLFPCPHCRYVTDRRNNLKRHISTMHQTCDKLLECCGVSFSTKASLREHIMIFHHNGYSCPYCGRRFCRKALLKRHLSVHSGQKDYTCPSCDYATSHKSNLERHKRIHERLKLGEDGSIFECGDFTSHPMTRSPDTTDTSCLDSTKDDSFIDVDSSDDESSDIDVTEYSTSDNEKLRNYPIIMPNPKKVMSTNETESTESIIAKDKHAVHSLGNMFNPGMFTNIWHSRDHQGIQIPQNSAIDYSKANYVDRKGRVMCATASASDTSSFSKQERLSEPVIGSSE